MLPLNILEIYLNICNFADAFIKMFSYYVDKNITLYVPLLVFVLHNFI